MLNGKESPRFNRRTFLAIGGSLGTVALCALLGRPPFPAIAKPYPQSEGEANRPAFEVAFDLSSRYSFINKEGKVTEVKPPPRGKEGEFDKTHQVRVIPHQGNNPSSYEITDQEGHKQGGALEIASNGVSVADVQLEENADSSIHPSEYRVVYDAQTGLSYVVNGDDVVLSVVSPQNPAKNPADPSVEIAWHVIGGRKLSFPERATANWSGGGQTEIRLDSIRGARLKRA